MPTLRLLEEKEIIEAVADLNKIYPYIPSLVLWRAWEYAAYRHYRLQDPTLDLACGDGQFFNLVWGNAGRVMGIDIDEQVCARARASGVYAEVRQTAAHELPFADNTFASVFSNCALEHMDYIDQVLSEACRVTQPGGLFIASVVTDKFTEWELLPLLEAKLGNATRARELKEVYEEFHHIRSPFTIEEWIARVENAGFAVNDYYPIAPEPFGRIFMLLDELWHVKGEKTEIGQDMYAYLSGLSNFSEGMQDIVGGLLKLSPNPNVGAGLIFVAEKRKL
ncbi:MAG: methyltransferase domain-containing protein [Anaerolineales bacterium]|nr:methyltransferase domain-containing protein [Anaerolineales bacterium]